MRETVLEVGFPGGKRVDAQIDGHVIRTDQPVAAGGGGSAPAPFDLFLASIGACTGIYVVGFCEARGIPTRDIKIVQRSLSDDEGHLRSVEVEILLPPGFPARYQETIARVAEQCKVKRTLADPPEIAVHARPAGATAQPSP
ncbi:MAG: OsmC family protein [Myxococcales bacterium]